MASGFSVSVSFAFTSHRRRCSARIPEVPPEQLKQSGFADHSIYASSGTKSSTSKGSTNTGMVSPGEGWRGGYPLVEGDPLCYDMLNGNTGRRWSAVVHLLVPPLHPRPCLLYQGRFRGEEGLDLRPSCLRLLSEVRLEACLYLAPKATEESLVSCGVLAHGDSFWILHMKRSKSTSSSSLATGTGAGNRSKANRDEFLDYKTLTQI